MKTASTMRFIGIVSLITVVCAYSQSGVAAAEGRGFPVQKKISGKSLVLNGTGIRNEPVYHAKVYEAGLYLETKSKNARRIIRDNAVKHLELRFLSRTRQYSVKKSWEEGFLKQAGQDMEKFRAAIDQLMSWTTSVGAGDTYCFTYVPDKGLEIRVKNKLKGVIEGEEFARVFFSIWLGRDPVNRDLKSGLLGR